MQRLALFLLPVALVLMPACGGEPTHPADTAPTIDVTTARAAIVDWRGAFEAGGVVHARTTATIVSRIMAEVREIRVRPGDRVSAGQVLVTLDSRELAANRLRAEAAATAAEQTEQAATAGLAAAEAGLTLASATYRRIADLRQKNSATPNELDEATAGLRSAEAQVSVAKARVSEARGALAAARAGAEAAAIAASYATLTAPFAGVVTEKLADVGNLASPGTPLLRVEDMRGFRLEVRLDASRGALIAPGQPAEIVLGGDAAPASPAAPVALAGTVAEVARALDPGSQAFLVKIDLPDRAGVRSGMFGRARFAGPARRALAVPASSLVRQGQLVSVYVVDAESRARRRLVNIASAAGDLVEVLAGLQDGETVVVTPSPALVDGARVRVQTRGARSGAGPRGPGSDALGGVQGIPPVNR
jgi:multidrug efflux pump subunit AcrA (membrane-fusion protein)